MVRIDLVDMSIWEWLYSTEITGHQRNNTEPWQDGRQFICAPCGLWLFRRPLRLLVAALSSFCVRNIILLLLAIVGKFDVKSRGRNRAYAAE